VEKASQLRTGGEQTRIYILRIRFHERCRISVAGVAARNHQVNPTGNAKLIVFSRASSSQAECRRLNPGLLLQEINLRAAWKTNISRAREDDDVAMAHHGWCPLPGDHAGSFPYDPAPKYLIFDRGSNFDGDAIDTVESLNDL